MVSGFHPNRGRDRYRDRDRERRPATRDIRPATIDRDARGRLKKSVESNALWFQGFGVSWFQGFGFQGFIQIGIGIAIGIGIGNVDPRPATFDPRRSTGAVRGRLKKSVESNALWFRVSGFLVSWFQGFIGIGIAIGIGIGSVDPRPATFDPRRSTGAVRVSDTAGRSSRVAGRHKV